MVTEPALSHPDEAASVLASVRELARCLTDVGAGLFRVTEDDEDAHSALEHRLTDRLGERRESVIKAVLDLAEDKNPIVAQAARKALGRLKAASRP